MVPSLYRSKATNYKWRPKKAEWKEKRSSNRRWYPSLYQEICTDWVQTLSIHDDKNCIITHFDGLSPDPKSFCARHSAGSNSKPCHPFEQSVGKEAFSWPLGSCNSSNSNLNGLTVTFLFLIAMKISIAFLWSWN